MANKLSIKEQVEKAIAESDSLIQALECVAAMYNIPSENIIVDDRLSSIRVQGDTILAPDKKNPSANTKSIVCAIGAVLDNIGQRIDQKLDAFQHMQVSKNSAIANQREADPSKGEVVGRFFDSEGSEIIAYSTGLVDMSPTRASLDKVRELRASKQIPDIQDQVEKVSTGYFNDEDDVMNGVDSIDKEPTMEACDIAKIIHEDPAMLDLYDYYNGSKSIGYELLQEQGFNYVDRTHAMIMEAEAPAGDGETKEDGNSVTAKDLKDLSHMRFDNSHLMKAVQCFNEALDEIHPKGNKDPKPEKDEPAKEEPKEKSKEESGAEEKKATEDKSEEKTETPAAEKDEIGHVNTAAIFTTAKWKEGVREIEQQFKCSLNIKYFKDRDTNCFTPIDPDVWRPKLKISKSKGFQLGGMTIGIGIAGHMLDLAVKKRDRGLFGQSVIGIFLHEIFHNITAMIRYYDFDFISSMSATMLLAAGTNSAKARRVIFSNYAKSITGVGGKKLSLIERRKLVRQMMYISTIQDDAKRANRIKSEVSSGNVTPDQVEDRIKKMQNYMDKTNKEIEKNGKGGRKFMSGFLIVTGIIAICTIVLCVPGILMIRKGLSYKLTPEKYQALLKEYIDHPDKEEYYCDLFSGIYNLPVSFLLGGGITNGMTGNEMEEELMKKLASTEKDFYQMFFAIYPTDSERCYAAMKVAQKALQNGGKALSPECRSYMEWIVKNYSNLDKAGIKENYNQATFNPEECEDLDEHIQRIIAQAPSVQVTESYKPR